MTALSRDVGKTPLTVATSYFEQDPSAEATYAQMRGDASSEGFRDTYRRCLAVLFVTARIACPDARLGLVLNTPWRRDASPVAEDVSSLLDWADVTMHVCPYTFEPPPGWPSTWWSTFFKLDALQTLARDASAETRILLLDSDVLWSGSDLTSALRVRLQEASSLTLHIDYEADRPVNGLSRTDMTDFAHELGLESGETSILPHSGGEFVALSAPAALAVCERAHEVWPHVIAAYPSRIPNGMTEEHLLSMVYADLGLETGGAAPFVKRLWTQPLKYRNTEAGDERLPLWHVPAEKRYGLRRLFDSISDGRLRLAEPDWVRPSVLGPYIGVPHNPRAKVARDLAAVSVSRVRERFERIVRRGRGRDS